jgi:hypothetical protein
MSFPNGYDPITLNHWLWYKYKCHECSAEEFQRLFENKIKRYKPEFMQIRPYGNIGDRKCDGLFLADSTIFQVYSPDELKQSEVQKKIDEDLAGAVKHWGDSLKTWVFVYNVRRGLPPDIPKTLQEQQKQYPNIKIDHLSSDALWEMARELSLQQRAEVLSAPAGYEYLYFTSQATSSELKDLLEKAWFVLVQDTLSPISISAVVDALQPDSPFGVPIIVRPIVAKLPWSEAAEYQKQLISEAIARSGDLSLARFAVFSMAQIPLVIHLGFLLSDRVEVHYFQHDRDRRSWRWPETAPTEADCNIQMSGLPDQLIESEVEVVIRVSLSARIAKRDTDAVVHNNLVEIDIFVDNPDVMWLRSFNQLMQLGRSFRQVLTTIRNKVPRCSHIHLFYAGPTGGGIIIGQQINPRMNPPVEVYEYSRQSNPCYRWALKLDEVCL